MIDWTTAPPWAKFVAMDSTGEWFWYEEKPSYPLGGSDWKWKKGKVAQVVHKNTHKTLQERPNAELG
jgi:hypothetical protein